MTISTLFLLLCLSSWILVGVILLLHRYSPIMGLFPLAVVLGGMTAIMQLQVLGGVQPAALDRSLEFLVGNYLLMPVILVCLLIIYITNGSIHARVIVDGIIIIIIICAMIGVAKLIFPYAENLPIFTSIKISPRFLLAQALSFLMAIIAMFVGYASISNFRSQFPSRLAGSVAILFGVFIFTLVFEMIAHWGSSTWWQDFAIHLATITLIVLASWPLLIPYLFRVAPKLPDSVATIARPPFDFFLSFEQLESRAQYNFSLLRTLSHINQLIVRTTDPDILLQEACEALVDIRKYHMVWIGKLDQLSGELHFSAQAGFSAGQVKEYVNSQMMASHKESIKRQAIIVNDTSNSKDYSPNWRLMMQKLGCLAVASFPMRSGERILGTLNVGMDRPNSFGNLEIDLLQELADDLAYALISLKARSQQTLLQTSAETMRDGLLILNTDGEIIYANEIVARFIGLRQDELFGKNINAIITPEQAKAFPVAYETLLENDVLVFDVEYQLGDGKLPIFEINTSLGRKDNGEPLYIVANIRDVTSQRKYEHQLLTLHHLTTDLVQIHEPKILSNMILEVSEDALDADASGIYLIDPQNQKIIETLTRNLPDEYSQHIASDYSDLLGEISRKTLQPVYVHDTLNDSTFGEKIHFMADYGIRALLILPMLIHETLLGALTVYYHQPHSFQANDIQIGLTLAQTMAIVYQNAKLYQAEHSQREFAEALVQATASINSSLELEQVLDQLLEQVMRVIPCRAANIIMIDNEYGYYPNYRGYEDFPKYIEFIQSAKLPLAYGNLAKMIATGEPCLISDTSQDPTWLVVPGGEWIKGYAAIPLKVDQQVVGFLNVDSDKAQYFTNETVNRLWSFADFAATAIQNARLYQAELNQREFAEALTQAAASVSSSLELNDVLDHILEQAMRVVPCQAANIMLIEKEKVTLARHRGYENFIANPSILEGMEFPINWPGLQEMYSVGKPVSITDTVKNKDWQTIPYSEWIRSYIGIPLKVDQQVVGFLNIDSDKPNFLTPQFVPRLQIFADHASTAIKNARAYENSKLHAEEMAALVTAASAVSKSLDLIQVLQIISEQMTKVLQVRACAISNFDPELKQVNLLTEYGHDNWEITPEWYQPYDLNQFPLTLQVLENNQPLQLHFDDPNLDESERSFMEEAKIASLLMLPLVTQDRTIGLVELMDTKKDRNFSEREISLGLSLASHAAAAIENANLYQRLQEHATELEKRVDRRTQQLQAATEYIEGILASVPDAIFVLDENQEIVRANQAGERLLWQAKATGLDLFNPQLLRALENGDGPNIQSILEVQDRAYQALSSQLSGDEGQTTRQVIVFRDVTRFRELDQMKTQFVSDVSHELRTPLTNLTLYLGLLTTVRDPLKQNDYILTMQRETERLTHLIEDLLTISRLEASRIQFQIRATDINQLLENLVCDRAFLAAQKNIALDFAPAENLPLASADENMLTQALSNLLTNAINYTLPKGSITVHTDNPEPDWVTVVIADTGVGIPAEETERIFDRFYRGGASQKTGAEGTGLGLAISEEIIHRLNGKITLESIPEEGSTFTIWLRAVTGEEL